MTGGHSDEYGDRRDEMVDRLERVGRITYARTAEALRTVPRHKFVPESQRAHAYEDRPLPIGDGQTISAPHMVAMMADRLALRPGMSVLEIGTGCGYHAAVTAEIVGPDHVYTVEFSEPLAIEAEQRLDRLGYDEIAIRVGDGYFGWPEQAPFDRAYFTCAVPEIPDPVVDQLESNGLLLAPVGTTMQTLTSIRRTPDGSLERDSHGAVRFVPLRRTE